MYTIKKIIDNNSSFYYCNIYKSIKMGDAVGMAEIKYVSTRGNENKLTASQAILKGIADDGGLFVPTEIPAIKKNLSDYIAMSYQDLAYEILSMYITDFTEEELRFCINSAYDDKFDTKDIAPLVKCDNDYFLELFHGKTLAFKDMALSILPYLLTTSAKKNNMEKEIVILTATSGDTGKAALEGFANTKGTSIVVFYPADGVSPVQERQMTTQEGKNTSVVGVVGNFDDTQTAVKEIFTDEQLGKEMFEKGYVFSSANSINIGRLLPQIVYYFYAYAQMVKSNAIKLNEKINFTVPTGNFGNILSGYFAKKMGLPIDKLICASNENKVLYDFFENGEYNKNRQFVLTSSPSMDILISSNLERLIYLCSDAATTKKLFEELKTDGKYKFDIKIDDIIGEFATQEETSEAIKEVFNRGYVMDTHTAVAYKAYKKYLKNNNDTNKNVIVSTASPYKFTEDVCKAIDLKYENMDAFILLEKLAELQNMDVPAQIKGIDKKEIRHTKVCEKHEMKSLVKNMYVK